MNARRLVRRAITFTAYPLLCAAMVLSLPLLLPLAVLVDLLRPGPSAIARSLLFFAWYLLCETLGLLASFTLLPARPFVSLERWQAWHFTLEGRWAAALLAGGTLLFGLRVEIVERDPMGEGPIHLFVRHVSVADTVLAAVLLQHREGWRLRYVLKRELLWDPCLDLVGQRLPNYFIDRGGSDSQREIEGVRGLAADVTAREGVLIYPEGTRFSAAKQARVLERLAVRGDTRRLPRARALRNTLPPRLGGPLALLEARPDADVIVLAHRGFEGTARFSEFLAGGLRNARVEVALWRIPAEEIPLQREEREEWLDELWLRVDRWIGAAETPHRT